MQITILGDRLLDSKALTRLCTNLVEENQPRLHQPEVMQVSVRQHHHVPLGLGRAVSLVIEAFWSDGSRREVAASGDHVLAILPQAFRSLAASLSPSRVA